MSKYRKKPVVIEAVQWRLDVTHPAIVSARPAMEGGGGLSPEPAMAYIDTANGMVRVNEGDWIVTDPASGDVWPVRADIFAATYEAVDD